MRYIELICGYMEKRDGFICMFVNRNRLYKRNEELLHIVHILKFAIQ